MDRTVTRATNKEQTVMRQTPGGDISSLFSPSAPIFPLCLFLTHEGQSQSWDTGGGVALLKLTSKQHNGQTSYLPGMFNLLSLTQTSQSCCKILLSGQYKTSVILSTCKKQFVDNNSLSSCYVAERQDLRYRWPFSKHKYQTFSRYSNKAIWYKGSAIWTKGISVNTIATNLHKVIS